VPYHDSLLHHLTHHFDRTFEIEGLARVHIQLQGNGFQMFLAVHRQFRPSGYVLADRPVDILITTAPPTATRGAEVNRPS
jgi:hypothetical protein